MKSIEPNSDVDDWLELERVAVGPYCIFDGWKPALSPRPNHQTPIDPLGTREVDLEAPAMSTDFSFNGGMRGPWLSTSGDEMVLAASAPEDVRSDWNEWMQWDPASAPHMEAKPLQPQGAMRFKPDQSSALFNRRENAHMPDPPLSLQVTDVPTSAPLLPQLNTVPFTFGGNVEQPPAFDFDGNTLSSPSSGGGPQQNGFQSPPMWEQQKANETAVYTPVRFEQPGVSPANYPPASTPSLRHSPSSVNNRRTSSSSSRSSPEPVSDNPKKRKSSTEDEPTPASKKDKGPPVKKTAHNMIEKRYRTNLNDKIAALRDSVPSLRVMSRPNATGEEEDDPEDLEGLTPAHKLNKATVLSKATEYIRHLEKRSKRLQEEVSALKSRLESYEKMSISGAMSLTGPVGASDGGGYHEDPYRAPGMVGSASGPPQGMIPVPEAMANLHRGILPQPHYAPAYPSYTSAAGRPTLSGPPLVNGRRSSAMMGKLMVGSLAGLMIFESFMEREPSQETTEGRGLFAIPFHVIALLNRRISFGAGASVQFPFLKVLLIFGAVYWLISPYLESKPKSKKSSLPTVLLAPVPSLALPVEVRRKAWLTAIQTVWVPQHNFLLEMAALGLKTLKLSTRKIIGWHSYALVTGITKEQEAARVKAWDIAVDAQLTGGDAEISKSRLILTLMASGTLPDTPARLMLKALHIRVLLWEIANARQGSWSVIDGLSAKLARMYWNAARSEQKIAANLASKPDSEVEPLPEHLQALLMMECDDVLIPNILQRAYNLAWNRPIAEMTVPDESMDGVVEDFSISSPLDALAAWWSSHALKKALARYLSTKHLEANESVRSGLASAVRSAPPTSQARLRALVAQAVLLDEERAANIATAYKALPSPPNSPSPNALTSPTRLMNVVSSTPIASDVRNALTLAKCLSLIESSHSEARRRAIYEVNNTVFAESRTTLLSFVAGFKLLSKFIQDAHLQAHSSYGLERLAGSLRLWVGHDTGRRSGLSKRARSGLISKCLDASKTLVGLGKVEEVDDGYVSQSERGD